MFLPGLSTLGFTGPIEKLKGVHEGEKWVTTFRKCSNAAMLQSGKNTGSIEVHAIMKVVKASSALGHHNKLLNVKKNTVLNLAIALK